MVAAIAIIGSAWLLRTFNITTKYDIFIDEITYTRIAENLATGRGLELYGVPFDLHPPAVFAFYTMIIKVFGIRGSIQDMLFYFRPFAALFGACSCCCVFFLVRGIANWRVGVAAACLAALDPFAIYYDSHVMLEAPAQLSVIGTVLLLEMLLAPRSAPRARLLVAASGLTAGVAICAKENFGLVIGLTLLLCLVTGWVIPRRQAALSLAIMGACGALSEVLEISTSGWSPWWNQVGSGVRRLIGTEQTTGFNSPVVHVSLLSRLDADFSQYSVTYVIMAAGTMAGALLLLAYLRRRRAAAPCASREQRALLLVGFWWLAAVAYIAYSAAFGTLEEQMFYLLFLPCLSTAVLGAWQAMHRVGVPGRRILLGFLVALVTADSAIWLTVQRTHDDEYRQLMAWEPTHIKDGAVVAVTDQTAEFLLHGVVIGQWSTIPALIGHHVDYVILGTKLVREGYGTGTPQLAQYLQTRAKVVFRASGPSDGELVVYDVRAITGRRR